MEACLREINQGYRTMTMEKKNVIKSYTFVCPIRSMFPVYYKPLNGVMLNFAVSQ